MHGKGNSRIPISDSGALSSHKKNELSPLSNPSSSKKNSLILFY